MRPTATDVTRLELSATPEGTRLRLRVKAGARKTGILGVHGGALKLTVSSAPEKGKANRAVLELLAEALELAPSALEIVAGGASQDKVVLLPLHPGEVMDRLRRSSL